ncbi:MAG TPA: hypothetical protein VN380_12610 [Thermoanaerobaculia bacterium]|nr:hypothetical protein [Thermoanaerobaculia bacterium]
MRFARMALFCFVSLGMGVAAEAAASGPADIVLPAPHPRPAAVGAAVRQPVRLLEGCGSTPVSCNTDIRGQLAGGDCLAANITLYDEFVFQGIAQELVTATVRPLDPNYGNAWIGLVPPPSDASLSPLLSGGVAATVRYFLPAQGTWRIQAGTNDRFGAGQYLFEMNCDTSPPPSPQLACVEQDLLCGQQATWDLSSQSCVAASDPTRFYAMYRVWGVIGDTLNIRLTSSAFDPQFAIYEFSQTSVALAQSSALNATTDTMSFSVPHNDFYDIVVTSGNAHGSGQYTIGLDCSRSGCLIPIFTQQPEDVVVPRNTNASLTVQSTALGDVDYEWFDADGAQNNVGSGPKYATVPITTPHRYFVTATTPCGTATSRVVQVAPAVDPPPPPPPPTPRHRAARH